MSDFKVFTSIKPQKTLELWKLATLKCKYRLFFLRVTQAVKANILYGLQDFLICTVNSNETSQPVKSACESRIWAKPVLKLSQHLVIFFTIFFSSAWPHVRDPSPSLFSLLNTWAVFFLLTVAAIFGQISIPKLSEMSWHVI